MLLLEIFKKLDNKSHVNELKNRDNFSGNIKNECKEYIEKIRRDG